MKIDFEQFTAAMDGNPESGIVRRMAEYGKLRKRLEDTDNQSWYLKKSLPEKREQLKEMRKEFDKIRDIFKRSSLDDLIAQLNEKTEMKKRLEGKDRNMVNRLGLVKIAADIMFINELIGLKTHTSELKSPDYYYEHFGELLDMAD